MNPIVALLALGGIVYVAARAKSETMKTPASPGVVESPILNRTPMKYDVATIPRLTATGISSAPTSFSGGPASGYSGTTGGSGSGRIGGRFGGALI